MRVGTARAAAVDWVLGHASREIGFRGAYFSGSTVGMPDDAELAPASDVDVVVVTERPESPLKLGKFLHLDTLVEVTHLPWQHFTSADEVLTSYHLAGSFRVDTVIADPTGQLRALHRHVASRFAEREWVLRRCENARQRIENRLRAIDPDAPWAQQVMAWLFPTGVTTHVLLVAALRNPTVRLRYLAAREVLADYGHVDRYPDLLTLLGCAQWSREQAEHHLAELASTFDAAAVVARTPFFFSSDITGVARPIAIDGSCELIESGRHREAVFWMVATFARCHTILAADAPELHRHLAPAFEAVLADLGITSTADLVRRADAVFQFLPELWATAEDILDANPGIHPAPH